MNKMLYRHFVFSKRNTHPATRVPAGEIWVKNERSIDERSTDIKFAPDVGECPSAETERYSVVFAQFYCPSGKPHCLCGFFKMVGHPSRSLAESINSGRYPVSGSKARIKLSCTMEVQQCF